MLFSSPVFIFIFLPLVAALYFALNHSGRYRLGKQWLILSSIFFYGYWNPIYIPLILASMLGNYQLAKMIIKKKSTTNLKKNILILGIFLNLAMLAFYKYTDFFTYNINHLLSSEIPALNLALPLAISFFTFQQIAYLVDCFQDKVNKQSITDYGLFVCFFPQLIAGPIVHHKEMMPQFNLPNNGLINHKNILTGLIIFGIGMFKKLGIADTFSAWADKGFDSSVSLSFMEAWGTTLSYTFQLYYDFSGYTDMAIGAALIFNIRLPQNFNSPYKSTSIQDFWRRWHITLSHWLRDYLYIPLGGNRNGESNTYINLFITFLLGGLWHGAGWGFIIWGALHGSALCIHRAWQRLGLKLNTLAAWGITFLFVHITWVFFRAKTPERAFQILSDMTNISNISFSSDFADQISSLTGTSFQSRINWSHANLFTAEWPIILAILACLHATTFKNSSHIQRSLHTDTTLPVSIMVAFAITTGLSFTLALGNSSQVFLYFNF